MIGVPYFKVVIESLVTHYLLLIDLDISLPDEILCNCGGHLVCGEESGHCGEDREKSAGL